MITIERMSKQDIADVAELEDALFGDHGYSSFFIRQAFDCWPKGMLVAKMDGQIAGYLLCAASDCPDKRWILSLAVAKSAQGQGVGRKLLEHAGESDTTIFLTVSPENHAALKLYTEMGFIVFDEEDDYFGPGEHRLVLRKE